MDEATVALQGFCTNSLMLDEQVQQIPFFKAGSFYCEPCANSCQSGCQKQEVYYHKFKCQCHLSDSGCKLRIQDDQKYAALVATEEAAQKLKEYFRVMLQKKMDDLACAEIPRNMLQEQQFEMKFETYTE